ncbi:molybdopterin-dependent oxidoreductase [Chloroflexota bacterium]
MSEIKVKKTVCMQCHDHCKVAVHVRDGQLIEVREDEGHPRSAVLKPTVRACPRARAAAEWFYHPDRLRYPLKKAGERGEGKWQEVSWEQALDEIAQKLAEIKGKYGAEAIATSSGTYRTHDEYKGRFMSLLGSPNYIGQGHICWGVNNMVSSALTGMSCNGITPRPGITKCMFLIGTNPRQAERGSWHVILNTKKSGAKLIVADPRQTEPAQWADIWLQLRPGTDCALLMGMINAIINEGLYDRDFVEKWCYGFDKLAERARDYPLEKVAEITWVPAEKIEQAAIMYATNKPAMSYNYMGLEQLANVVEALHARFILPAITGNIDVRGGDIGRPPTAKYVSESETELDDMLSMEQKKKQLGADRFRLLSWAGYDLIQENVKRVWGKQLSRAHHSFAHAPTVFRAMLTEKPYSVKAMITLANNPLVTMPDTKLVYKALKRLELYVVMDYWLTPSAERADYVLPSASWLERTCISTACDTAGFIAVGEAPLPAVKEGEYERRTDYEFWRGLGMRLGQEEYWPWKTLEDAYGYRLAPLGYNTLRDFVAKADGHASVGSGLQKHKQVGFATPTGKLELYSTILEKLSYDPLPRYHEPPESPISTHELAKEYPLVLTTGGRFQPMYHSEHRQIDSLRKQHPDPIAQVNPQTAAELDIEDGDWIWIETPRGRIRQKCRYFKGIDPRVIHAQHGWWFPELPGEEPWLHGVWESNINTVTDDELEHCNKISGGWPLRALLCRVYKAKKY